MKLTRKSLPVLTLGFLLLAPNLMAQNVAIPNFNIGVTQATSPSQVATSLQLLVFLTVLTLAPAIIILTTSFTRIVIVFSFLRNALGTQQSPPTQVLVGLAIFLTVFIMAPVWQEINRTSYQPYSKNRISQTQALDRASVPLKNFMVKFTREKDLALFLRIAGTENPKTVNDVPIWVLIPAFVISELKTAFIIGFVIYIPFLIIDMIVASILMAMGMMMLPPVMISLPLKIMLFVIVDGWHLLVGSLVESFKL